MPAQKQRSNEVIEYFEITTEMCNEKVTDLKDVYLIWFILSLNSFVHNERLLISKKVHTCYYAII